MLLVCWTRLDFDLIVRYMYACYEGSEAFRGFVFFFFHLFSFAGDSQASLSE